MAQIKEPVYIQTTRGVRRIRKVSLGARRELSTLLDAIFKTMTDTTENDEMSFSEMYDQDDIFRQMCNDAISLSGLNPHDIDIDTLYGLLLPHTANEGTIVREAGILVLLNFPPTPKGTSKGSGRSWESVIAMLWHISGTLQDTLDTIYDGRIDAEQLIKTLDEYAKLQNPEEYTKRKLQQKAAESLMNQQHSNQTPVYEEVELYNIGK